MEILGAAMRSAALTSEGYRPDEPLLVLDACDSDGKPVHVQIAGGHGASGPARQLADAATALAEASERAEERAESRRVRSLAEEAYGGPRPDAPLRLRLRTDRDGLGGDAA